MVDNSADGQRVQIGLPTATFAAGPSTISQPPAAAASATAEAPAISNPPGTSLNAHANANGSPAVNGSPQAAWDRSKFPQLAADVSTSVTTLWAEFCHLQGWPLEQREIIFSQAVLKRFNAITPRDLTERDLRETEENLAKKIDAHYTANGTPMASPFRGELAAALARVS